jgi:hypothetical protein
MDEFLIQTAAERVVQTVEALGRGIAKPVFLAGGAADMRSMVLAVAAVKMGKQPINVGFSVSSAILVSEQAEARRMNTLLDGIIPPDASVAFLDRIAVLFAPSLQCNALDVLAQAARRRTICASWPGRVENGRLRYADYGHPECLDEDANRALVIDITQSESAIS